MSSNKLSDYGQNESVSAAAQADAGNTAISQDQLDDLERRVEALECKPVNLNSDITGLFEVVSVAPAGKPKTIFDQVKLFRSGATKTLYLYDYIADAWRSVTLS